jgi:hypothetical protein
MRLATLMTLTEQRAWAQRFVGKEMRVSPHDSRFKGQPSRFKVVSFTIGDRGRGIWFTLDHSLAPTVYRQFPDLQKKF